MKKGMIKVTVFYPQVEGKTFDMDYYCTKHMTLASKVAGKALKGMAVEKGIAGSAPNSPALYAVMGHMYFKSMETFQVAFNKADQLMADIPNFTNIEPLIQISEVVM
jgi:uncharacterized protein (TIGR02118 family)